MPDSLLSDIDSSTVEDVRCPERRARLGVDRLKLAVLNFASGYRKPDRSTSVLTPIKGLKGQSTMKSRRTDRLSTVEQEVIQEIRELRNSSGRALPSEILRSPAQLVHHFIRAYRGNVQLRIRAIAGELGIEMRTLERAFTSQFGKTMAKCQADVRLEFSCWMLSISPPSKIDVIATLLGYERVQDFTRFFRAHTGLSPVAWRSTKLENIDPKGTASS